LTFFARLVNQNVPTPILFTNTRAHDVPFTAQLTRPDFAQYIELALLHYNL
jgi:hypothetical protein